jgi:3,4-dihydroxyphenylacetate 2,3-dioxygenase
VDAARLADTGTPQSRKERLMGRIVFVAKVTHIPRMVLSELPGPLHGCRDDAIQGLQQIGERIVASGADTVVILDTHWLSNAAYHVNAGAEFQGVFTSSEFPTQIEALEYDHVGNPALAKAMAAQATASGVATFAHERSTLGLEYGTLVPMHFMKLRRKVKVVSVSG